MSQQVARINKGDLSYGFERGGVICSLTEADLIINRYDSDGDGKIGYWEFANMVLTCDPVLREEIDRRVPIG